MKKAIFFAVIMAIVMTACKKHEEYQINIEEVQFSTRFANGYDFEILSSDNEYTQIFEVVPGLYTITSDYVSEGVGSGSNVNLKLKLRLLRPVKISNELDPRDIEVILLDANDKIVEYDGMSCGELYLGGGTYKSNGKVLISDNKAEEDAIMEMLTFLSSPAGTEEEITFGAFMGMDMAKCLKNVTGIEISLKGFAMSLGGRDRKFGDKYSHIEWAD